MIRGFVQSVSGEEISRREIASDIFEKDWGFLDDLVVGMALDFSESEQFDDYAGLNSFLRYVDSSPGVLQLDESQRYFVKSAAEVYFYSNVLGKGMDYLNNKMDKASLSPVGVEFVANVLFDLYCPESRHEDPSVMIIRQAYKDYLSGTLN